MLEKNSYKKDSLNFNDLDNFNMRNLNTKILKDLFLKVAEDMHELDLDSLKYRMNLVQFMLLTGSISYLVKLKSSLFKFIFIN